MTTQYNRPERFYPTREQEQHWEGESQAKADELLGGDETVTLHGTNEAWKLQLEATELYLNACLNDMPDEVIEARREDMIEASDYAETMQELYSKQYEERWEVA